jgi:nucleoside-diphosphate-sugar epimerase
MRQKLTSKIHTRSWGKRASFVGDGRSRWAFVDVDDLAWMYILLLEKAPERSLFNAAQGPSFRVREAAEVVSIGAGACGKTQAIPFEEARKTMGAFADALVPNQQISGEDVRKKLGWSPRALSVLGGLKAGSYAQ